MPRTLLRDDQWDRIQHLLSGKASDRGVTAKETVHFLKLFSGLPVRAHRGETFPQSLGIGIDLCAI